MAESNQPSTSNVRTQPAASHVRTQPLLQREPRTLVLCFDGTGNSFDSENTNVVRFFSALEKRKRDKQLCYYQPGIGTYVSPTVVWAGAFRRLAKLVDQAFAWYLGAHIMSGYRFLMDNYHEGDKICLFGFSRGAYTARCLAGMLHKVGLLPKKNEELIQFAWDQYKDVTTKGRVMAAGFKKTFSTVVNVDFIGVWDTVASVGVISRHLSFSSSNRSVKIFRHALALDEHRAKFKPNPYHRPVPTDSDARQDPDFGSEVDNRGNGLTTRRSWPRGHDPSLSVESVAYDHSAYQGADTDVKEVWFAGCHADVGGGSVSNNTDNSLANPSLAWMVNECIINETGIIFRPGAFKNIPGVFAVVESKPIPPEASGPEPGPSSGITNQTQQPVRFAQGLNRTPLTPTIQTAHPNLSATNMEASATSDTFVTKVRQVGEVEDATAPMYDQLKAKPIWWLLEIVPIYEYKQDSDGRWHKGLNWNKGKPRQIQTQQPFFHKSVKIRQDEMGDRYRPRAKWDGEPIYVD